MSTAECDILVEKPADAPQHPAPGGDRAETPRPAPAKDLCGRISTREIAGLTRQLATLLRAGMPLVPALAALSEQYRVGRRSRGSAKSKARRGGSHAGPVAQVLEQIHSDLNAGQSLSASLARYPDVFCDLYVNMVAAGQASGDLDSILLRLAEILEKRVRLAAKVKSVIAYPLVMAVVAVGVVVFLLSSVVPSITQIFLEMDRALPWPTTMLIAVCSFMAKYWVLIPVAVCGAFFALAAWLKTEKGRMTWDRAKLSIPLFGPLFLRCEIARMARTLSVLLGSGIPILSALETVRGVVQNRFIASALSSVKDDVGKGRDIAEAVAQTGLFPPVVVHIIATGTMAGSMEQGLGDIADMYDDEIDVAAKTLTSLLEPAILLVMGAVIGCIVLAVLLPIFDINQAL